MMRVHTETDAYWDDAQRDMDNGTAALDIELRFQDAYEIGMIYLETYEALRERLQVDDPLFNEDPQ
jgi:hypothetical protein